MMEISEIRKYIVPCYSVNIQWSYLETWLEEEKVDLNPDFQRHHVWSEDQQAAYVEHVIRGGGTQQDLFFNNKGWNKGFDSTTECVDGKQRLTAVRTFIAGDLAVFNGHTINDFTYKDKPAYKMLMLRHTFRVHIHDLQTRAEVLQWYLDINRGGTVHTDEEIQKVRDLLLKEKAAT